jgi:hypothetical protein
VAATASLVVTAEVDVGLLNGDLAPLFLLRDILAHRLLEQPNDGGELGLRDDNSLERRRSDLASSMAMIPSSSSSTT